MPAKIYVQVSTAELNASAIIAGIVWELLGAGADPASRGENGWTPLLAAAIGGHAEIARQLIGAGAQVEEATLSGWNALHMSSQSGHKGDLMRPSCGLSDVSVEIHVTQSTCQQSRQIAVIARYDASRRFHDDFFHARIRSCALCRDPSHVRGGSFGPSIFTQV